MRAILQDMVAGRYTDIDLSAFLTACTAAGMSLDEVVSLTRGIVQVGDRVKWDYAVVADKHGVGGLPGNRTSPIVVFDCRRRWGVHSQNVVPRHHVSGRYGRHDENACAG